MATPATNRELTERAYAALASGDLEAFLALIDPDVEFKSLIAEAEGHPYRGHDGVREWWEMAAGALGGLVFKLEDLRDLGDRVVTTVTVTGTLGGTAISQTMYQALRLRQGKTVWWSTFRTLEEALEAAEAWK